MLSNEKNILGLTGNAAASAPRYFKGYGLLIVEFVCWAVWVTFQEKFGHQANKGFRLKC